MSYKNLIIGILSLGITFSSVFAEEDKRQFYILDAGDSPEALVLENAGIVHAWVNHMFLASVMVSDFERLRTFASEEKWSVTPIEPKADLVVHFSVRKPRHWTQWISLGRRWSGL